MSECLWMKWKKENCFCFEFLLNHWQTHKQQLLDCSGRKSLGMTGAVRPGLNLKQVHKWQGKSHNPAEPSRHWAARRCVGVSFRRSRGERFLIFFFSGTLLVQAGLKKWRTVRVSLGVKWVGPCIKELFEKVSGSEVGGEMTHAICSRGSRNKLLRGETW